MEAVMLIAEKPDLLPVFKHKLQLAFPTASFTNATNQFVVHISSRTRIYIEYAGTDLEYIGWEPEEITAIIHHLPKQQHIYSIAYHEINAVKAVLVSLANSDDIMVDNDCGSLLVGSAIVARILIEPNWNWLQDFRNRN
jgi:hypothetical protein